MLQLDRKTLGTLLISALSAVGTVGIIAKCGSNGEVRIEVKPPVARPQQVDTGQGS